MKCVAIVANEKMRNKCNANILEMVNRRAQ